MNKNRFYHVLQVGINPKKAAIPRVNYIRELTDREGAHYYLFELPLENKLVIGDYELKNHHLSVYENHSEGVYSSAQYHYTAFFLAGSDQEYRLHVYFNAHDDMVQQPEFSLLLADGTYKTVDCQEFLGVFKALSEFFIKGPVTYLRSMQSSKVHALQKEYTELNLVTERLSVNLEKNKDDYLASLDLQINKLNELIAITNDNQKIFRQKMQLTNLKKAVLSMSTVSEKQENTSESDPVSDDTDVCVEVVPQQDATSRQRTASLNIKPVLGHELESLNKMMAEIDALNEELQIKQIGDFFDAIRSKESEVDLGLYLTSVVSLNELHALSIKVQARGLGILQRLLVLGQYEKALIMRTFFPYLPANIVHLALVRNNLGLLNFLLKNEIISLGYKNFTLNEKQYSSLVEYCFENTLNGVTKADILDILVKNGSSLMELNKNGMPYAAVLLLNPKHPLRSILEKNTDITIGDHLFYKQLNQILSFIAEKPDCTDTMKAQINALIAKNKGQFDDLKIKRFLGSATLVKHSNEALNRAKDAFGIEFIEKIQSDLEIQAQEKILATKLKALLPKFTLKDRLIISRKVKIDYDALKENCKQSKSEGIPLSFDEIKQTILQHQVIALAILNLYEEQQELRIKLQQPIYGRKVSRERKKIIARFNETVAERQLLANHLTQLNTGSACHEEDDDLELGDTPDFLDFLMEQDNDVSHQMAHLFSAFFGGKSSSSSTEPLSEYSRSLS